MGVPLFASSLEPYHERLTRALADVVPTERFILGPEVAAFEEEFARWLGVRHCVGVANGTDALTIALRALGVEPGDEVVVPSFTFYASVEAVVVAGAKAVFCDVEPETFCVSADTVRAAMTPRTRAVMPVHLFGNLAPVPELRELGVPVLEDAAQAAGSELGGVKAGALGHAATFSFFPSKNLPCLGDGGAVVTDDDDVAERVRVLRYHGSKDKRTFTEVGFNSRLDALQAAALRVLLPELDGWTAARRAAVAAYEHAGLGDHAGLPRTIEGADPAFHLYVVRHADAEDLADGLREHGVEARGYYRVPVHRQPAMAPYAGGSLDLPGTEEAARTHLALPMGTRLSQDAVQRVVRAMATLASPA
jgi:dTDP-3-amino-3,4,6-trideoxy-alpha-D-glucose transaminase